MSHENNETALNATRGMLVALEATAEALVNIPSDRVIADIQRVACNLGCKSFNGFATTPELEQRYYDRFFIPTSPYFIPLSESRITDAADIQGSLTFGPPFGPCTKHAEDCYRQIGFDYSKLVGFDSAIQALVADSLACEVSFLAFLKKGALVDTSQFDLYDRLAAQFISAHDERWIRKAVCLMKATDDDFYARLVDFAADLFAIERELYQKQNR